MKQKCKGGMIPFRGRGAPLVCEIEIISEGFLGQGHSQLLRRTFSMDQYRLLLRTFVTNTCPFKNLPDARSGRQGEGLTAAKMKASVWVRPELAANSEFLDWMDTDHVLHIKLVGMRDDKDPRSVERERIHGD